jgi:5-formyltetrahydrofolate cyclo-ligase
VTKKEIRKMTQEIRDNIDPAEKNSLDEMIIKNLFSWDIYKNSAYIFCYVSFRSEIDTSKILRSAMSECKTVTVPKIDLKSGSMRAFQLENIDRDLAPGEYGILEPRSYCREAEYQRIDLIIAPGLGFTNNGGRLGYGGGYYDRFIKKNRNIPVCALTYDRLVLDYLPVKDHDVPVDYLITEKCVKSTG